MDSKESLRKRLQESGRAPRPKIALPAPAAPLASPKPKIANTRDLLLEELDKDVERAKYLTIGTALIVLGVFLGILIAD